MRRLLLVDDHDLFRQVLAVGLEQHTDLDESIQAMSVDEARQALSTHNDEVALAILAIDLYEEEEVGLIEDLRALAIPVLMFTDDQRLER